MAVLGNFNTNCQQRPKLFWLILASLRSSRNCNATIRSSWRMAAQIVRNKVATGKSKLPEGFTHRSHFDTVSMQFDLLELLQYSLILPPFSPSWQSHTGDHARMLRGCQCRHPQPVATLPSPLEGRIVRCPHPCWVISHQNWDMPNSHHDAWCMKFCHRRMQKTHGNTGLTRERIHLLNTLPLIVFFLREGTRCKKPETPWQMVMANQTKSNRDRFWSFLQFYYIICSNQCGLKFPRALLPSSKGSRSLIWSVRRPCKETCERPNYSAYGALLCCRSRWNKAQISI